MQAGKSRLDSEAPSPAHLPRAQFLLGDPRAEVDRPEPGYPGAEDRESGLRRLVSPGDGGGGTSEMWEQSTAGGAGAM